MKMKGVAITIGTIIFTIILVTITLIFIGIVFGEFFKIEKIVLEAVQLSKVKNTFYTLNSSLAETWRISTIQTIFQTMDDSIGCGLDDDSNNKISPKYWLQTKLDKGRTNDYSKIVNNQILPAPDKKYNSPNDNPRICTPKMAHLKEYLENKMEPFLTITKNFIMNDNNVVLTPISALFDSLNPDVAFITFRKNENIQVFPERTCNESRLCVNANVNRKINIDTETAKIVFVAREITESLVVLSNLFLPVVSNPDQDNPIYDHKLKYQDICSDDILGNDFQTTPNKDVYAAMIKERINTFINIWQSQLQKSSIFTTFNRYEFLVPSDLDGTDGILPSGTGLLLHYDASIRITEKFSGPLLQCTTPPEEYKMLVEQEVSARSWSFGTIDYDPQEIIAVILSMINKESSWDQYAISDCGAVGLMQLMPGTAKQNGISVIYKDASFTECNTEYAEELKISLLSRVDPVTFDGRFDPQQNIRAGVNHFHKLLGKYSGYGEDALVLAIAAYNAGEGNVDAAISSAGSSSWNDVRNYLFPETQDYVPSVSGCIQSYGGSLQIQAGSSDFAWPTQSRTITSCYGPRPSPYHPSLSDDPRPIDYHGGIDIGPTEENPTGGDPVYAALGGTIMKAETCSKGGECIMIEHTIEGKKYYTWYIHLSNRINGKGEETKVGDEVESGFKIGEMGYSGTSGPASTHLHFEIRDSDNRADIDSINPCLYLDCSTAAITANNPAGCRDLNPPAGSEAELPNIAGGTVVSSPSYYYHDEANNEFVPRPISMVFKAEDYLSVIDCITIPNAYREKGRIFEEYQFYYWDGEDKIPDVICYKGCIYTCNYGQKNPPNINGMGGSCPHPNKGDRTLESGQTPEDVEPDFARYVCGSTDRFVICLP